MKIRKTKQVIFSFLTAALGLFLLFCLRSQEEPISPSPSPLDYWNWDVEMTSDEIILAWLDEQAQEAKEFFFAHEELFERIKEAALTPQITEVFQEFYIDASCSDPDTLHVGHYRPIDIDALQKYGPPSVTDLSSELEQALAELLKLHAEVELVYTAPEDEFSGHPILNIGYSYKEFPTAIFCTVTFWYHPDQPPPKSYELGNGWYIYPDYIYMYGL